MRKTKQEIEIIKESIRNLLEKEQPMSVRQVFYRIVSMGIIKKSEAEYRGTVIRLLGNMRKDRTIPYHWIADNTRWVRRPNTHSSMTNALEETARLYRRSYWDGLDIYLEFWLEKDALSGVIYEETNKWDVPLLVTRGYPSLSFLYTAGEHISRTRKKCYLYYLGDHDPSGINIPIKVEESIREFAPNVDLHFEVIAVTADQINKYDLPTRPTKLTDSRSKSFFGESVELDAIPSKELRQIVKSYIDRHLDPEHVKKIKNIERLEKESTQIFLDTMDLDYGI